MRLGPAQTKLLYQTPNVATLKDPGKKALKVKDYGISGLRILSGKVANPRKVNVLSADRMWQGSELLDPRPYVFRIAGRP